jgi:hypothetical protein
MNRFQSASLFWTIAIAVGLLGGFGCAPVIQPQPVQKCPGIASAAEIVVDLQIIRDEVAPLRSGGSCLIRWIGSDNKIHEENPSIDVRFFPPDRFFLRGNILGSETIRMGSNADEFWLAAPPKEISAYWWGKRDRLLACKTRFWLNPAVLLECCGMYDLEGPWSLSREPGWDVLTRNDASGKPEKRLYVGTCDRRIGRIEYLNEGKVDLSIVLQDYPDPGKGPCVPATITIEGIDPDSQASAILTLQNLDIFEPTEAQLKGKLFARPQPQGYDHVYELSDSCEFLVTGQQKEVP